MSRFQTDKDSIFLFSDISRPRMTVEKEKMARKFPKFKFYGHGGKITSVQGYLKTNYGKYYYVRIEIPDRYPYVMPRIFLPNETIDKSCRHVFTEGNICVMKSEQWSSTLSLAFIVGKTAVWLNKYDTWKRGGMELWPGTDQHR